MRRYREPRYKERRRLSKAERSSRKERKQFRYNAGPGGYAERVLTNRTGAHFKRGF